MANVILAYVSLLSYLDILLEIVDIHDISDPLQITRYAEDENYLYVIWSSLGRIVTDYTKYYWLLEHL